MSPENKAEESIFSFWRRGLVSDQERNRLSQPLREFLGDNNIRIHSRYYPFINKYFEGRDIIVQLGTNKDRPFYLVDPNLLSLHLGEVTQAVLFAREEIHQERTEEERMFYREKILRIGGSKRGHRPISLEQAQGIVRRYCIRWLGGPDDPQAKSWAEMLVGRAQPYLTGRVGDFESLGQFRKILGTVMVPHIKIDRHRREEYRNRSKNELASVVIQSPRPRVLTKEKIGEEIFNQLDPLMKRLVEYKAEGVYSFEQISMLLGVEFGTDLSADVWKQRYYKLLAKYE